eukprot:1183219-Prorocentrum_minimum.AAC.2
MRGRGIYLHREPMGYIPVLDPALRRVLPDRSLHRPGRALEHHQLGQSLHAAARHVRQEPAVVEAHELLGREVQGAGGAGDPLRVDGARGVHKRTRLILLTGWPLDPCHARLLGLGVSGRLDGQRGGRPGGGVSVEGVHHANGQRLLPEAQVLHDEPGSVLRKKVVPSIRNVGTPTAQNKQTNKSPRRKK